MSHRRFNPNPPGSVRPPEVREALKRGQRRRIVRERVEHAVTRRDLASLARPGAKLGPGVARHVAAARAETLALLDLKGGPEHATAAERLLAEDYGRAGLLVRVLVTRFAQEPDPELAPRIVSLLGVRRGIIATLGTDERRAELSLDEYLRTWKPEVPAGAPIEGEADPQAAPEDDRSAGGEDGREPAREGGDA